MEDPSKFPTGNPSCSRKHGRSRSNSSDNKRCAVSGSNVYGDLFLISPLRALLSEQVRQKIGNIIYPWLVGLGESKISHNIYGRITDDNITAEQANTFCRLFVLFIAIYFLMLLFLVHSNRKIGIQALLSDIFDYYSNKEDNLTVKVLNKALQLSKK